MAFYQGEQSGRLTTVLGGDELSLLRVSGSEHVNTLFSYTVEAMSTRDDQDFDGLIGTHATVEIDSPAGGTQSIDGIVTQARFVGIGETGYRYDLELRPWLWLAGKRRNQRIFHDVTVVELLKELFGEYDSLGSPAFEMMVGKEYPKLEYTVQFSESDLDFACRLMERFGISYVFEHSAGNHKLILFDDARSTVEVDGGTRPFFLADNQFNADGEHFWEWRHERNLTTGAIRLADYNFKTPNTRLDTSQTGDAAYKQGRIESFDWPGHYQDRGRGEDAETPLRVAQERGQDHRHYAVGDCLGLRAGMRVTLEGDEVSGATGTTFLCLSARQTYTSNGYGTTGTGPLEGGNQFHAEFVLMPEDAPLAPRRKTPLSRIYGPHTAKVVGDGEIDCDEHGRILVRFHWDLEDEYSMRCRVSQNWAGRHFGGLIIPRYGMEVVVEFLDGDPDKPLVTGCVYNGSNYTPTELPKNKTRSVFKTKTHEGEGFNELTFEDKKDDEFIYIHAAKNYEVHVENSSQTRVEFDENISIGNDSNLAVKANRTETIDADLGLTVKGQMLEKVDGDRGMDTGGSHAIKTGGDLTIKAGGEIVLDASKITLVAGGAALVVSGTVNAAPVLNVGSASPGAAALPAIPAVLEAAAGEGSPFVSHCPLAD